MATLHGMSKRTIIERIEIVNDDQSAVLMVDRDTVKRTATFTVRKPHESRWDTSGPRFVLSSNDLSMLSAVMYGNDAEYALRDKTITTDSFMLPDVNGAAVEKEVEARCSQLDIERAKAANMVEEKALLQTRMSVDHVNNKHGNYEIAGCEMCEMRIRPGYGDGSLRDTAEDQAYARRLADERFDAMPSVDADNL